MQGISRYIVDSRMRQNYSLVSHSRPIRKFFIEVTQKSHQIFNTSSYYLAPHETKTSLVSHTLFSEHFPPSF